MTALLAVMSVVMFQHVNNVLAIRQSTDIAKHPIRVPVLLDDPSCRISLYETHCIVEAFKEMNGQGTQAMLCHNILAVGSVHFQTVSSLTSTKDGESLFAQIFLESAEADVVTDRRSDHHDQPISNHCPENGPEQPNLSVHQRPNWGGGNNMNL